MAVLRGVRRVMGARALALTVLLSLALEAVYRMELGAVAVPIDSNMVPGREATLHVSNPSTNRTIDLTETFSLNVRTFACEDQLSDFS